MSSRINVDKLNKMLNEKKKASCKIIHYDSIHFEKLDLQYYSIADRNIYT